MGMNGKLRHLSGVQKSVLQKMKKGQAHTANDLHASLATMRALERERLVKPYEPDGAEAAPRFMIKWQKV